MRSTRCSAPRRPAGTAGSATRVRDTHVAFGGHEARAQRHLLLPALHAVQSRVGWISEGALNYVCTRLSVPPADAWGVATFYALFSTTPRPRRVLHVCDDIACKCRGADELIATLEQTVGPEHHAPTGDHVRDRGLCVGALPVPRHVRPRAGGSAAGVRRVTARDPERSGHPDRSEGSARRAAVLRRQRRLRTTRSRRRHSRLGGHRAAAQARRNRRSHEPRRLRESRRLRGAASARSTMGAAPGSSPR